MTGSANTKKNASAQRAIDGVKVALAVVLVGSAAALAVLDLIRVVLEEVLVLDQVMLMVSSTHAAAAAPTAARASAP